MSRLADIYKSEKRSGGGLGSTLGKAALEKIDPRKMFNQQGLMAAMLPALFKAYSATPKSRTNTMSSRLTTPSLNTGALESQLVDISVNTRMTAKNTMVLPMMARDSNLTKLNIMKVVKLLGGKATKSSDMFWKNSAAREKEYESKFSKEKSKTPTPSSSGGSPAAAGGAGGLKGIGLDFLSSLAGGIGKGVGIAAIGLGIGGFFAGLAAGGAAVNQLGGASGVKDMLVNLAEGLGAFSGTSLLAFGALLGAGMLFGPSGSNPVKGAFKGINMSIGIASIGLGLGGFLAGLALGGAGIAELGGSGGVKTMMIDLAEGLNAFNPTSMAAFGTLLGAGMLFGAVAGADAGTSAKMSVGAGLGMTMIGLGLGGFLAGLALGGAGIAALGGSGGVKQMLVDLAEGLNAFNPSSMAAFGTLLATGGLFGVITGVAAPVGLAMMGGTMLGMTAIGLGLGGFLAGLALGGKGIDMLGGGKGVKDMMVNLAEGLNAFGGLDAGNLVKLAGAIPAFGVGMLGFFGLQGIGGIVKSFSDGMKGVTDWIFGNNKTGKTPMQQLASDLTLFQNINGDNLSKIGQGFKDLASGLLGFASLKDEDLARAKKAVEAGAALTKNVPTAPSTPSAPSTTSPSPVKNEQDRLRAAQQAPGSGSSMSPTKDSQSGDEPSEELISNIKKLEGFSAKAFWDHKQYSIGYGTKANSENEVIDEKEADRRLRAVVKETRDKVVAYGKKHNYSFNSSQIDSLTSFAYNLGPGILDKVTDGGKRTISEIAEAIPKYNKASGEVNKGLEKRRNIELAMFNANPSSGATTTLASAPPPSGGKTLASASTSMSDQRMAAMKPGGGNTTINAPTTNVAQNGGGGGGNNVNPYNADMARYLLRTIT